MAEQQTVHDWLIYLAGLNVGGLKQPEVELRLAVLAPALAEEFPEDVFTPQSARMLARQKYFPTFSEVCEVLSPLARENRERNRLLALPAPRPEAVEPYKPPPAPDWCFDREPRLMGRREPGELKIQAPLRSVEEQLAELRRMMAEETSLPMAAE